MASVRLRRLVLFNFRTFVDRHELTLPEKGLVILRGPSGYGKTNVLLGLAYAFGFCRLPARALQTWYDDRPFFVEVHLDTPEGPAVLHRGDKLWLETPAKRYKGSAKAVEAELDRLCGVEVDLREALTYRDQVKPKQFLAMKDAALKEFLVQVLRLHGLEAGIEAQADLLTGKRAAVERAAQTKQLADEALGRERQRVQDTQYEPQDAAPFHAALAARRVELKLAQARLAQAQARLGVAVADEARRAEEAGQAWQERVRAAEVAVREARGAARAPISGTSDPAYSEKRDKLAACERHLNAAQAADTQRRAAQQAEAQRLAERRQVLVVRRAAAPGLRQDVERLTASIDKLQAEVCDRCGQKWVRARVALEGLRNDRLKAEAELAQIAELEPQIAALTAEIAAQAFEPDPKIEKLREIRAQLQTQMGVIVERQRQEAAAIRARYEADLRAAEDALKLCQAEAARARDAVLAAPDRASLAIGAEVAACGEAVSLAQAQVHSAETAAQRVDLDNERTKALRDAQAARCQEAERVAQAAATAHAAAEAALHTEEDYLDLLKGFRNRIFDEVLEDISNAASEVVGALPNAAHIGVQFRSERETDKGVKQEIRPVVTVHGEERALEETVSGGQLTSIGLAVDLAVGRVLSARLGCHLDWIVFDESLPGHDAATKQACLEVLQIHAADKLVLLVDHASELQEMFAQKVDVISDGKRSRLA